MILDLLLGLARANLAIAAAVVAVALLRRPLRRPFGARAAYLLWIAPVLAGAAALVPPASGAAPLAAPVVLDAAAVAGGAVRDGVSAAPGAPAALLALWLAGVAAAGALLARRQARFVAGLGRLEPLGGRLFRTERSGAGPAVVGALRPRIVTPADFEVRFDAGEREVILAHEEAHLASGDAAVNALAAALQCVCWFNPLVHAGVRLMRLDQELACDARVLRRFPEARRLYAEVLLKTQLAGQPLPFGCLWPAAGDHPLKERIVMLKSPLPAPARRAAGFAAVTAFSLAGACAAWAAQPPADPPATPAPPRLVQAPDWVSRPTGEDVARAYPAAAAAQGLAGNAVMTCRVGAEGRLGNCQVIKEAPAGAGFGDAALKLAERFRMNAQDETGATTAGADVRIPILFRP